MNYEQLENNKVFLCGIVRTEPTFSHEVYNEPFFNFEISVQRLSGQADIVPITISERLMQKKEIKINDTIALKGQFRSYNKLEDNKSKLVLSVFVRELVEISEDDNPNSVEISGYICKTPIYRTTPFNREIADMLVAVNRSYNKSDYIPCIAWGRNARFVSGLKVGTKVSIIGRVQSREYNKIIAGQDEPITKIAYEVSIAKIVLD